MKPSLLCIAFAVPWFTLAQTGAALAQEAAPPPPPAAAPAAVQVAPAPATASPSRPSIVLTTAPVAPAVARKYHFHEGFYLRTSLGFGDYRASFTDNASYHVTSNGVIPGSSYTEHGGSMSLDLLIGGSPSPGVSIGGALLLEPLFGADYDRGGSGTHGGFATLVGPFIDAFPDTTKGWHLGGLLGLAGQSFQSLNNDGATRRAGGIGGAAWFGYDFWVAGEWAIGPQIRVMGMRTTDTHSNEDISAWARSFTLGISAVFN
ncbi:MAG: hypothetical protein ABI548_16165 [Polyangiaceae bacterium]